MFLLKALGRWEKAHFKFEFQTGNISHGGIFGIKKIVFLIGLPV